jgi:hypothetical protein
MSAREDIHKLIDDYFDKLGGPLAEASVGAPLPMTGTKPYADTPEEVVEAKPVEVPTNTRADGTRVVRSKSSGDKVYLLNDNDMTKRWVVSPEVLRGLGFDFADVQDVSDLDFLKYKQQSVATS